MGQPSQLPAIQESRRVPACRRRLAPHSSRRLTRQAWPGCPAFCGCRCHISDLAADAGEIASPLRYDSRRRERLSSLPVAIPEFLRRKTEEVLRLCQGQRILEFWRFFSSVDRPLHLVASLVFGLRLLHKSSRWQQPSLLSMNREFDTSGSLL